MYDDLFRLRVTDDSVAAGGTYTLLVELPTTSTIEVGALGEFEFEPGWYAYTGSALGSGGFSRVDRHQELAAGARDTRHWHIDYLLGHPAATLDTVIRSHGADIECAVASTLDGGSIPAFGCSDCDCLSHLHYGPQRAVLLDDIHTAHNSLCGTTRQPEE